MYFFVSRDVPSCYSDAIDIAFLVDVSSTICSNSTIDSRGECIEFKQQKSFIASLTHHILLDDSTTGLISASTSGNEFYGFNEYIGADSNWDALDQHLVFSGGEAVTTEMMDRYVSYLAVNQSARHELGRTQAVIVILSDVQDDFECEDTRSFFSATMSKDLRFKCFFKQNGNVGVSIAHKTYGNVLEDLEKSSSSKLFMQVIVCLSYARM